MRKGKATDMYFNILREAREASVSETRVRIDGPAGYLGNTKSSVRFWTA